MLIIAIIFTVLVALWGYSATIGVAFREALTRGHERATARSGPPSVPSTH